MGWEQWDSSCSGSSSLSRDFTLGIFQALRADLGSSSPLGLTGLWVCTKGAHLSCGQVKPGDFSPAYIPSASYAVFTIQCSLPAADKKQRLEFCLNPYPPGNSSYSYPVKRQSICFRASGLPLLLKSLEAWHCGYFTLGSGTAQGGLANEVTVKASQPDPDSWGS